MSHKLGGAGSGYVWPDLSFCSDGERVLVSSRPTDWSNSHPIRYLAHFNRYISVDDFEQGVDAFVNTAVERLTGRPRRKRIFLFSGKSLVVNGWIRKRRDGVRSRPAWDTMRMSRHPDSLTACRA